MRVTLATILIVLTSLLGCAAKRITPPQFDGNRAFQYLVDQVEFGPRVPGTVPWAEARTYYYDHFQGVGAQVDSQAFTFFDPYSKTEKPLVNIIARIPGLDRTALPLLLVAHWDCRPRTDHHSDPIRVNEPIAGANDGASGVAVLMELANLFQQQPPASDVVLLLVDGEDWGEHGDNDMYLLGSKEFAARGIRDKYRFGIVIDMVGDKSLQIYREAYSDYFNKPINDMIWRVAKDVGAGAFIDEVKYTIMDDHLPLNAGGLPAVDLIDFDYEHWHTENDLPENCSPASLEQVGRVLAYIAYNPSVWPKK